MDIVYSRGQASATEVMESLPDPPSYSAVRAMLRILEEKGQVRHREDGPRYIYQPVVARETARKSAVKHLLRTFFDGSVEQALAALLDTSDRRLSREEVDRLSQLIEQRKQEGR